VELAKVLRCTNHIALWHLNPRMVLSLRQTRWKVREMTSVGLVYIGLCSGINTHSKHPTSLVWVHKAIPALYQYQLSSHSGNTSLVSVLYQPQDQVYWGWYKTSTIHQYMYALMYKHMYCMCMYIKKLCNLYLYT